MTTKTTFTTVHKKINKYKQQFPVFHVVVKAVMTHFQGKIIKYLSYCLHFRSGMKLHDILDNSCYTNSWYLKKTGEILESEKPVGEDIQTDCGHQSNWGYDPPKLDKC